MQETIAFWDLWYPKLSLTLILHCWPYLHSEDVGTETRFFFERIFIKYLFATRYSSLAGGILSAEPQPIRNFCNVKNRSNSISVCSIPLIASKVPLFKGKFFCATAEEITPVEILVGFAVLSSVLIAACDCSTFKLI